MLIDIHTHTYPTSDDSTLTPEKLISESKKIGLDGICITDHDGFWDPSDIKKLSIKHDFLILPGCEVTTEEGHLLVYGLEEYIFGMHKSKFVKELVNEVGGAIVVAHPYRRVYRESEISNRLSLHGYPLQKTIKMAANVKWDRLLEFHDFALRCDFKIKDGVLSEEEALDWLILEMSS